MYGVILAMISAGLIQMGLTDIAMLLNVVAGGFGVTSFLYQKKA